MADSSSLCRSCFLGTVQPFTSSSTRLLQPKSLYLLSVEANTQTRRAPTAPHINFTKKYAVFGGGGMVVAKASNTRDNTTVEDIDYGVDVGGGDSGVTSKRDVIGVFDKLKSQRVKAIVNKMSRIKQEIKQHKLELDVVNEVQRKSGSERSELHPAHNKPRPRSFGQHKVERNVVDEFRGKLPNERRDNEDSMPIKLHNSSQHKIEPNLVTEVRRKSQAAKRNDEDRIDKISEFQYMSNKPRNSLRGWGNGGSTRDFDYESESNDYMNRHQKFSGQTDFFSRRNFKDLGFAEFMIESLRSQGFMRPSHIQAMAFGPVTEGKSCILADQSGSGKTLAYLIPVLQRLRQEELQGHHKTSSRAPRAVVMVPTAELASQVLSNCRSMSKFGVPFRSMVATGGFQQKTQLQTLDQGVDVLICTPGRFIFLIKEGFLQLTDLKCAVLDEVDILYNDEDFGTALELLMNSSPVTTQYLFVTATLPVEVYNKLVEVFPDCEVILGPRMHRISSQLQEFLVDCSGDAGAEKTPETAFLNKKSALLQLVEENPVPKTIVFCNKIESCRKVENALKRFDRKETSTRVLPFHAALERESRVGNLKEFTDAQPGDESLVLVCTDRASRGIDFTSVDHVVLFDFPRDPSEYVRRVGRTARGASGKGKAFIFVVGKQVSLARKIIDRNQKGHPLHDVPSAYELTNLSYNER